MEQVSRRTFKCLTRDRYLWGNKSSKHLARVLKKKRDMNYFEKIQNKKGEVVYTSKVIAEEFRTFYETLYLNNAGLSSLQESESFDLDRPITEEEIYTALKESAPGPDGFTTLYLKKFKKF